jgi:hypothetical protein
MGFITALPKNKTKQNKSKKQTNKKNKIKKKQKHLLRPVFVALLSVQENVPCALEKNEECVFYCC